MTHNNINSLLQGLQHNMMNYALILTSDRRRASTLMQQTTLRVLDIADTYQGPVHAFKTWVFDIMRSLRGPAPTIAADKAVHSHPCTFDDEPECCYRTEEIAHIIGTIQGESRRVVEMHLRGFTISEISGETGHPMSHLNHRLHTLIQRYFAV